MSGIDYCECGRGAVVAVAFKRNTSLLVRRLGDVEHWAAADLRCADCIGDMAEEIGRCSIRLSHPEFQPTPASADQPTEGAPR